MRSVHMETPIAMNCGAAHEDVVGWPGIWPFCFADLTQPAQ